MRHSAVPYLKHCLLAGLIAAASVMTAFAQGKPARIVLERQVTVDSESYTLGQIGLVMANDSELVKALEEAVLGSAPRPGQSLFVHQSMIVQRLKQAGFAVDNLQIEGQGPVRVLRGYHTAAAEKIIEAVRSFIEENAPWDPSQMKIRPISYTQEHRLTSENVTYQVAPPKHTDWLGSETFTVTLLVDGQVHKKTAVPAFIEVWSDVVASSRPLGRGQPITEKDIKVERMDLARVPANVVVRPADVVGKRTSRPMAANTLFRDDLLEQQPLIRKGDIVRVVAENQALKIGTQARAREDGAKGMRIALTNMTSKKIIYGLVVDSRTVQVQF